VRLFLSGLKTAGFGGKILWGRDLATRYSVFNELFLTASAGAMMKEFEMGRKVRCHRRAVENCGKSKSPPFLCRGRRDKDGAPLGEFSEEGLGQPPRIDHIPVFG
jgi:hypothetical protein